MENLNYNKEYSHIIPILVFAFIGIISIASLKPMPTGFAVYGSSSQSEFDEGIYQNTLYNGSSLILSENNLTGTYESKIFDAENEAVWNSLTVQKTEPSAELIFSSDAQSDIWKSENLGVNWTKVNDDYNNGAANGGDGMIKDSSNNLFIMDNQDLWQSADSGANWIKINDDFNIGDSSSGIMMSIDSNDNIYIIDGSEDIYKSADLGLTFTNIAPNFNGANGDIFGISIDSQNNIFIADAQSDVWKSSNLGINWTKVNDDYNNGAANGGDGMIKDSSNNLFIMDNQDLWQSADSGANWIKINDDFNIGDSSSGIMMSIDSNDNIYIIDGSEDIYKSEDSGITFTNIAPNFNGANGNIFGISNLIVTSQVSIEIKNCSQLDCSDGTWHAADLDNINSISRYFQYKLSFSRQDIELNPAVQSLSIDYDLQCIENWTAEYTSCNSADQKIKYYTDSNSCGATINLPADNGTIESCDYCSSAWENLNSSCQIDDSFIVGYVYTNNCCAETGLASDCNIPINTTNICDYCIPSTTSENSSCQLDNTLNETFTDINNCYNITGLDSDKITGQLIHNCTYTAPSESPSTGESGGGGGGGSGGSGGTKLDNQLTNPQENNPAVNEKIAENIEPDNSKAENSPQQASTITGRVIEALNGKGILIVAILAVLSIAAYATWSAWQNSKASQIKAITIQKIKQQSK